VGIWAWLQILEVKCRRDADARFAVIDKSRCGERRDVDSFPIPAGWAWRMWDYGHLNELLHRALTQHDAAVAAFRPFVKHTLSLEASFIQQVQTATPTHTGSA
jgi:hypothetical protein